MEERYWVFILAHKRDGALYVGVTGDLEQRMAQHRGGSHSAYTKRYNITRLVYAEPHDDLNEAKARERRVKKWRRAWKVALIEAINPEWRDLAGSEGG